MLKILLYWFCEKYWWQILQSFHYFLFHRLLRLCSHSVAVADRESILPDLVRGVRVAYRSSITYPQLDGGAGRKGGRKRKQRIYVSQPENSAAKKPSNGSPFTEIWHNNNPLVLKRTDAIPPEKNRCGYCGGEFPRGILVCRPYDIVLSHSERWQYPNKQRSGPNDPKFLPSPAGRLTVRFYCVKHECIFKRFPYFRKELVEIPDELELWPSHKKLLNEQLNLNIWIISGTLKQIERNVDCTSFASILTLYSFKLFFMQHNMCSRFGWSFTKCMYYIFFSKKLFMGELQPRIFKT